MIKMDDTIDNEARTDVFDYKHALFRANKLKVSKIFDKFNINKTIDKLEGTLYESGKIIEDSAFDTDIDNIHADGIYYFKSIDACIFYEIPTKFNGIFVHYDENGEIFGVGNALNGVINGVYYTYFKHDEYTQNDVNDCGNVTKISGFINYYNGVKHGKTVKYYPNGEIYEIGNFLHGFSMFHSIIIINKT
jgi:antitoxin component YwqK of YwqJK toxin-antitoxin module